MFGSFKIVPIIGLAGMLVLGAVYLIPLLLTVALTFFPSIYLVNKIGFGGALPVLLFIAGLFFIFLGEREKRKSKI